MKKRQIKDAYIRTQPQLNYKMQATMFFQNDIVDRMMSADAIRDEAFILGQYLELAKKCQGTQYVLPHADIADAQSMLTMVGNNEVFLIEQVKRAYLDKFLEIETGL